MEHTGQTRPPDTEVLAAVCSAAHSLLAQSVVPVGRLRVRCGDVSVELRSPAAPAGSGWETSAPVAPATSLGPAAPAEPVAGGPSGVDYVRSPMVGTFYHAPSPDAAPFIQVGDVVDVGQQVGVLEAMKLMNPVEAEQPGRVVEILVPDATGVEHDQHLIALAALDAGS